MKASRIFLIGGFAALLLLVSSFVNLTGKISFPYREAGLTERQAAAHLLSRFTFGARPGDIDLVIKTGLEKWFRQQLKGSLPDSKLNERLKPLELTRLSNSEVMEKFPNGARLRQMIIMDGILSKDSIAKVDKKEFKEQLAQYRKQKGLVEEKELFQQFSEQKIIRACVSENQLHEVLTDFWFNHFNVSLTKSQCARFVPAYERDAIRPNVTGKFENLLLATAKSPAMLLYLDNASSVGENPDFDQKLAMKRAKNRHPKKINIAQPVSEKKLQKKKSQGLNENYAREVMELHTLGVDGGYTQADVTEAARVLTGWTIYPLGENGPGANMKKMIDRLGEKRLSDNGFVHEGDFLFAINRHEASPKTVLGHTFSGGGYEEGVELLKLLAHHPSTAKFICRKLAVHFVNDNPPQTLIDKMTKVFLEENGDIAQVLTEMVSSTEFWSEESVRAKIKSPFEYAIGTVRSLNAAVQNPLQVNQWITRMGQELYRYQAPTGFPARAQYWINTGSLLNRMNFGLAIASKRIKGISFDLVVLNNNHEPESAEAALVAYAKILLPERDIDATLKRLTPLIGQPDIQKNIEKATGKTDTSKQTMTGSMMSGERSASANQTEKSKNTFHGKQMLEQVVGIIIGSPEFQRK